ncbi:MAG: hypothetical protein RLP44_16280 [Aggregatilineales bacterium]
MPPPKLNEYGHIGAIFANNQWSLFYEEGNRYAWAIDLTNADIDIPETRMDFLKLDRSNVKKYLDNFQRRISSQDIENAIEKPPLTFVINFDAMLFVDGSGEDGEHISIREYIPNEWQYKLVRNPYFFLPNALRKLWISKHIVEGNVNNVGIFRWCAVGAIKYLDQWRFFYEHPEMWYLDFETFMKVTGTRDWLNNPVYSDWRKSLPRVNTENASEYIDAMEKTELTVDEVAKLTYVLTESEQYLIEEWDFDESSRSSELGNALIIPRKPPLRYVIDFDEQLFIRLPYKGDKVQHNVDPVKMFTPPYWTCHIDITHTYLPADLQRLFHDQL